MDREYTAKELIDSIVSKGLDIKSLRTQIGNEVNISTIYRWQTGKQEIQRQSDYNRILKIYKAVNDI